MRPKHKGVSNANATLAAARVKALSSLLCGICVLTHEELVAAVDLQIGVGQGDSE